MPSADSPRPAPRDVERIGTRDLADWRTRAGRALVDAVIAAAVRVARIVRWSVANIALVLTVGVGLGVVLALNAVGAEVYEDVAEGDGIARIDQPVLDAAVERRTPELNEAVTAFTDLGGTVGMPLIAITVALGLALVWRRRTPIILMAIAGAGSLLLTVTGKDLVGRLRPPRYLAVPPYESSASFPSGHTLNATVVLGIAAYLVILWLASTRWRVTVLVATTLFVVAMGLSRVFLGHHWLTDVIAGWALGLGWLATVITGHRVQVTLERRRVRESAPAE